ncbi:MAG: NfeD family protein [Prolixibacteraceae bacterium]|nr:NfeD family protein [Prolixibacteraceae bacterium]
MDIFIIIFLVFLGLLLLLIEFAVIPGTTIAGVIGGILLVASVYLAFSNHGTLAGIVTLIFVIIAAPAIIVYFFKSKQGKKMVLQTQIDSKVETFDADKIKPGNTGVTISRLAPTGKVKINGEMAEAQSTGPLIDSNQKIVVTNVYSGKIIVEPIKEKKDE